MDDADAVPNSYGRVLHFLIVPQTRALTVSRCADLLSRAVGGMHATPKRPFQSSQIFLSEFQPLLIWSNFKYGSQDRFFRAVATCGGKDNRGWVSFGIFSRDE